jgi:predicted ATPase with chaperone activity
MACGNTLTTLLKYEATSEVTVNLAPADLPKDSGRFDLPIALGILAASGQIDPAKLTGYEFAGELSLSGELRPVRGALAMSLALQAQQVTAHLVLPPRQCRGSRTGADRQRLPRAPFTGSGAGPQAAGVRRGPG